MNAAPIPFRHSFPVRANIPSATGRPPVTTFTPHLMEQAWQTLTEDRRTHWLFYDGLVRNAQDYIDYMHDPEVYAYAVYAPEDTDTLLAVYFVNGFMGNAGRMHFCFTKAGEARRYAIGIETCTFLLRAGGLSALIGITPRPFRHAWQFALAVGFEHKAILPAACRLAIPGWRTRLMDAVVTLCTPETLLPVPNVQK